MVEKSFFDFYNPKSIKLQTTVTINFTMESKMQSILFEVVAMSFHQSVIIPSLSTSF